MGRLDDIGQFIHLDENGYKTYVDSLNEAELRQLHATISRKVVGLKAGIGVGIGGAILTGGATLMTCAITGRRFNVNHRRQAMIETRLNEMEWSKYEMRKRDYVIPVATFSIAGMVIPCADVLVGDFASDAAMYVASTAHAATSAAAHHGADAATCVFQNTGVFATSVGHGIEIQVNELTHGALGHTATAAYYPNMGAQYASNVGYAVGEALAQFGEVQGAQCASNVGCTVGEALAKFGEVQGAQYTTVKVTEIGLETAYEHGLKR